MTHPSAQPTNCATCPISGGCYWTCLRGDDLAEIAQLQGALKDLLELCRNQGDFKNGVTAQDGRDEGEYWASGVFDKAYAALPSPPTAQREGGR